MHGNRLNSRVTFRILPGRLRRLDPILTLALALALGFSLFGISWGRVEDWNRDQMALRELRGFLPFDYQKPPLQTYLNHILVLAPIDGTARLFQVLEGRRINANEARLLGSRLLVVALFSGTIFLAFLIGREAFGLSVARIIALTFASSAGLIEYDHFLSCDSPLLFFMLLTLLLAGRIRSSGHLHSYMLAGFSIGICTAMKYNGLAVGVTLVAAHVFANDRTHLGRLLFDRRLIAGLATIPLGFLVGNPGALLDFWKFAADFTYNSKVTPHYNGTMTGHGYAEFLAGIAEIIGLPGAILFLVAAILSFIIILVRARLSSRGAFCFALTASVFCVYFVLIGSFPRMENRFVLPAVPFLILMAGPFLRAVVTARRWPYAILVPILLYNCACCWSVGKRFSKDPRSKAQAWVERHARRGLVIESSAESPRWTKLPGIRGIELLASIPPPAAGKDVEVVDWRMPYAYGRLPLFRRIFKDDPWIQKHVAEYEIEADERLFTRAELLQRNPNLVVAYSSDYHVPSVAVRKYYADLLAGKLPYDIVFDADTPEPPRWAYPANIDFLRGRITILKRRAASVGL